MDRMLRPKASVLPDSALVPDRNLIQPAPNQFTHEVVLDQPYSFADPHQTDAAAGMFQAGTKVALLHHDGGAVCYVADGQGLYVATAFNGLRSLRGT